MIALLSTALGLAAGLRAWPLEQQVWRVQYPLAPAGRVLVENVQGDIRVEGWDRAAVEITAIKTALGPSARLENVRIAVGFTDQTVAVRTLYFGKSEEPVRVDYRLKVPREVRLDPLRTVVGNIAVREVEGAVDARSLNGNIEEFEIAGRASAAAMHGNVTVSMRALPEDGSSLDFETLSGNLNLVLPAHADADLELQTVAGRIQSPFAFVVSGVPGDSTQRARLGQGGIRVRLRTVRGDIRVTQREDML